jgi:hypothetical protein
MSKRKGRWANALKNMGNPTNEEVSSHNSHNFENAEFLVTLHEDHNFDEVNPDFLEEDFQLLSTDDYSAES